MAVISSRLLTALNFAAPLALMALIYYLSDQPDLSTNLGVWDLILRKLAHLGSFGLLTLLWWRALAPFTSHAIAAAFVITFIYAVSDEFHQTFTDGRVGSPIDVAIDTVGAAVAALLARTGRIDRLRRWPRPPRGTRH